MGHELESCPECKFQLVENYVYCPFCGIQLRQPTWKRIIAAFFLVVIVYGLIKCNLRISEGLDGLFEERQPRQEQGPGVDQ